MKSKIILIIFIASLIPSFVIGQEKTAKGVVKDKVSHRIIEGARINVENTDMITYSDTSGKFSIIVPKKNRFLLISKNNYKTAKVALRLGFQHKFFNLYLTPSAATDSLFDKTKNVFTLSLLESFNGAIAIRYEHFLKRKHAIGIHNSFYLFGRNPTTLGSEYDNYVKYRGVKASPFYHYYFIRKNKFGLYGEGKIQLGYIHFSELGYYHSSYMKKYTEASFWSTGFGISIGIMFKGSKKATGNFSIGYQYFPIHVPQTIEWTPDGGNPLTYTVDTDWWYRGGPGSYVDIKFTLGIGY